MEGSGRHVPPVRGREEMLCKGADQLLCGGETGRTTSTPGSDSFQTPCQGETLRGNRGQGGG